MQKAAARTIRWTHTTAHIEYIYIYQTNLLMLAHSWLPRSKKTFSGYLILYASVKHIVSSDRLPLQHTLHNLPRYKYLQQTFIPQVQIIPGHRTKRMTKIAYRKKNIKWTIRNNIFGIKDEDNLHRTLNKCTKNCIWIFSFNKLSKQFNSQNILVENISS